MNINTLEFQKNLKQKLERSLKTKIRNLTEEESDDLFVDDEKDESNEDSDSEDDSDEDLEDEPNEESETQEEDKLDRTSAENKAVIEIQTKAAEAGVDISGYMHGVVHLEFDKKEEVDKFMDFIEDFEPVEVFELKSCDEDGNELEEETDDCSFYRFWIYLKPDIVSFDYFDTIHDEESEDDSEDDESDEDDSEEETDEDDSEEETDEENEKKVEEAYLYELERKIKVNYRGAKRVKMQCAPGYKYSHKDKVCKKITGDLLITMRRAVKKTLIKKAQGGLSLKRRTKFRAKRADKFRKGYGL